MAGKRKQNAMDRILAWHGQKVAERIAQAILVSVSGPGETCEDPACPDRIRYLAGVAHAATARQIGGAAS